MISKHFADFTQALAFAKSQPGSVLTTCDDGFIVNSKGRPGAAATCYEAVAGVVTARPVRRKSFKFSSHHKACMAAQQRADDLAMLSAAQRRAEMDAPEHTVDLPPEQRRKVTAWGCARAYCTADQFGKSWAVTDRPINAYSVRYNGQRAVDPIPEALPPTPLSVIRSDLDRLMRQRRNAPQGEQFPCPSLDNQIRDTKRLLQTFLRFDLVAAAIDGDIGAADRLTKNLVGLHESRVYEILREITDEAVQTQAPDLSKEAYGKLARSGRIRCFSHKHAAREAIGRMTGEDPQTRLRHRSANWRSYTPPSFCVIAKHRHRHDWWVFENMTIRSSSKVFEPNEIYRRCGSERGYWIEQLSTPTSVPTWSVEILCNKQSIQTITRALDGERAGRKIMAAINTGDGNSPFTLGEVREADADATSDITVEEWEAGFMDFAELQAEEEAGTAD